jgi:hypothetical protein
MGGELDETEDPPPYEAVPEAKVGGLGEHELAHEDSPRREPEDRGEDER